MEEIQNCVRLAFIWKLTNLCVTLNYCTWVPSVFQLSREVMNLWIGKLILPSVLKYAAKDFTNVIFPHPSTITTLLFSSETWYSQVSFYTRVMFLKASHQLNTKFPIKTVYFLWVRWLKTYDYTTAGHMGGGGERECVCVCVCVCRYVSMVHTHTHTHTHPHTVHTLNIHLYTVYTCTYISILYIYLLLMQ